jgi:hypothetical protein
MEIILIQMEAVLPRIINKMGDHLSKNKMLTVTGITITINSTSSSKMGTEIIIINTELTMVRHSLDKKDLPNLYRCPITLTMMNSFHRTISICEDFIN